MVDGKVFVVTVTYGNRFHLLKQVIEAALREGADRVIVVDNGSEESSRERLREYQKKRGAPVDVLYLPENYGSAGGFHEGVKRVYNDGYDWIWLMDDDAEPLEDALEKLLPYASEGVAALANLKVSPDGTPQFIHRGFFDFRCLGDIVRPVSSEDLGRDCIGIDHASFVGLLVNSCAVEHAGFPRADFFLHFDDVEYCLRLRGSGGILLIPGSRVIHKDNTMADTGSVRILGRDVPLIPYDKLWLRYYGVRNSVWLRKMNMEQWRFYLFLLKTIPLLIMGQLISGDNILRRVSFILNAYMDGFKGRFDNERPKRILYDNWVKPFSS